MTTYDENNHLDSLSDAVNNDSVHDAVMGAIGDYCEKHDLDPEGFTYTLTVEIAEEH